MVGGGLPEGSGIVLQGPAGSEKVRFALAFLAEGLRTGGSGVLVIASQTAESTLSELRALGVDLDAVAKENRLRIVDWYSWNEEPVTDVEERGIILRSSVDLSSLGAALSRAIAALPSGTGKRAVIEMLSPALNVYELTQVYAFAQSSKRKFDRFAFTSIFLVEKDMHQAAVLSTLAQPFDGVIEIERSRTGDRIVRKIGVLHLRETTASAAFLPLELTDKGFRVLSPAGKVPQVPGPASPVPSPPGPSPGAVPAESKKLVRPPLTETESAAVRRTRDQLILEIAKERIRADPTDKDAWFALAAGQATLQDIDGSLASLEKLAALDPRYPGLWHLKAKLHARLGQEEEWRQARMKADEYEEPSATPATELVPCPVCAKPIAPEASLCPHCGSRTESEEDIIEELETLTKVTIQNLVEDTVKEPLPESEAKPPPEETAPAEAKPQPAVAGRTEEEVAVDYERTLDELAELVAPTEAPPPKTITRARRGEARKGLTNGLIMERAAARRTAGGQGRTNGLTNGLRGRTNGLTNGLTNGIGRTNGLTNGLRGRTNGLTNGLRGRTNGLTNGLGRTNGLTNGLGRTNGLRKVSGMAKFQRRLTRSPWTRYGVPVAVIALLIIPLFYLWSSPSPSLPIQIDGNFADWASVSKVDAVPPASPNPDIAITQVAVRDNVDYLSFYLEVKGNVLDGAPAPSRVTNGFFAFLDVDGSRATGYQVQGIGADRMVRVYTYGGNVVASGVYSFDPGRGRNDWNGWAQLGSVQAAGAGNRLEFQVAWADISSSRAPVEAAFASRSWDGQSSAADVVATSAGSYLVVSQGTRAPTVVSGTSSILSTFTFHAVGGDISVTSLNVTFQGTFVAGSLSAVDLVDASGAILAERPVAGVVRFDLSSFTVPSGGNRSVTVRPKVASSDASTVGAFLENLQDVVAATGGVALVGPSRTPESLAYVGAVPNVPVVDGGFSEWTNRTADPVGDVQPVWNPDVDLSGYAFQGRSGSTYFNVEVVGTALNGTMIPAFNPNYVPPSNGTGNGTVSPPGPPLPPENGTDLVRFFLDADGAASTGYSVGGIGADYLIEIIGKEGLILSAQGRRFTGTTPGDWSWAPLGSVPAAKDRSRIEAALPGVTIANASRAFYETTGWGWSHDDTSPASPLSVMSINAPWPSPGTATQASSSTNGVVAQDIAGNTKWFFTNGTAGSTTGCDNTYAASTTPGSSPTTSALAAAGSICWTTPASQPASWTAGNWEFYLDITNTTDGSALFHPNADTTTTQWTASGPNPCTQAQQFQCIGDSGNNDTNYIKSTSATSVDSLFKLPSWGQPPTPLTVINVTVRATCKYVAGSGDLRLLVMPSATPYASGVLPTCSSSNPYTLVSSRWWKNPATSSAWTVSDLNSLAIGVRDNDATTNEVDVSSILVIAYFLPIYSVEVERCNTAGCGGSVAMYGPTNENGFGNDVLQLMTGINAGTMAAGQFLRFHIARAAVGTIAGGTVSAGTVTVAYNGASPGTSDSRVTIPIPEFSDVAVPIGSVILVALVIPRWARRRGRRIECRGDMPR